MRARSGGQPSPVAINRLHDGTEAWEKVSAVGAVQASTVIPCPSGFMLVGTVSGQEWSSTNHLQGCLGGSRVEEMPGSTVFGSIFPISGRARALFSYYEFFVFGTIQKTTFSGLSDSFTWSDSPHLTLNGLETESTTAMACSMSDVTMTRSFFPSILHSLLFLTILLM